MNSTPVDIECVRVVARVRATCGIQLGSGPDDDHICAGVRGFVDAFDFRYISVVRKSVKKYRQVIVGRINPLVRRVRLEGLSCREVAERLIDDWAARNFVTAGGFAIEALAIGVAREAQKSATEGVDIQRYDPSTSSYHLFVVKSGAVTRNSDILKALKTNSKKAEKILRGDKSVAGVTANYAVATNATSGTTFEDGVRRPSSQDFWAEMTELDPDDAVDLILAMALEAGRLVRQDADHPLAAMRILVENYIEDPSRPGEVDWAWIETRTMRERSTWRTKDAERHKAAAEALKQAGYDQDGNPLHEEATRRPADSSPHT